MTSKLETLRTKIKFDFGQILNIKLLTWSTAGKIHPQLSNFLLIISNNWENVTFT
jgi:hypothetical protein